MTRCKGVNNSSMAPSTQPDTTRLHDSTGDENLSPQDQLPSPSNESGDEGTSQPGFLARYLHGSTPPTGSLAAVSQASAPSSASAIGQVSSGYSERSGVSPSRRLPLPVRSNTDHGDMQEFENDIFSMAGYSDNTAIAGRTSPLWLADTVLNMGESRAAETLKRSREKLEILEGSDISKTLNDKGAVAALVYHSGVANSDANDVWPGLRDSAKLPVHYYRLDKKPRTSIEPRTRPTKVARTDAGRKESAHTSIEHSDTCAGRPKWKLPVELVELIASHLNRDDIKAMRLVNQELNHYVSQVIFKTVVVPFNTEIYGMLGNEPKADIKGKKKARAGALAFVWKNANGDDVYDGHGLDVFRGFGRHIVKFAMAFEVNEDTLANPPQKCLVEPHSAFWGSYDWPFEEYCRFDDVAGLETAADETPRMKTAFSELSRVRELALSIDSGLGWLNGPDRSIRARILQRPLEIFGTLKKFPDRRAQAQRELWHYIEDCHRESDSNVRLATLYRTHVTWPPNQYEASMAAEIQPEVPFMDPHIIHQAVGHDATDICMPTSFEDPEVLERFVSEPAVDPSGILFTSSVQPNDAGQLMHSIIPTNLTNLQKEWLLETEWAQRAFLSSYMLSIIDNPSTFEPVHTLNISRLSDRHVSTLNRLDFWDALPNLKNLVLKAIPSWRSVNKNEAGVVETPNIDPAGAIDPFYALLKRVISQRQNITRLTIGWATGGEHAEGVHARNKHVLPAPLIGMDNATSIDSETLRDCLLQFPFVEHLTLENCWITPPALTEFVELHDALRLKHIVFESVSLTAITRNLRDNQQAAAHVQLPMFPHNPLAMGQGQNPAMQMGALALQHNAVVPNQILNFHIQALQQQIQYLQNHAGAAAFHHQIAALRAQLQNQIRLQNQQRFQQQTLTGSPRRIAQQIQQAQANYFAQVTAQLHHIQQQQAALPPPAIIQPTQPGGRPRVAPLMLKPRPGSWFNLIDRLTPGPNLTDFESEHSEADPERSTALQSMHFNSCGYVRLYYAPFEQAGIDPPMQIQCDPFFTKRITTLAPAMLAAKWPLLGEIMQGINSYEMAALYAGWNMHQGWEDWEATQAPMFDGCLPGGSGRFSGVVRVEDRVTDEHLRSASL